MRRRLRAAAAPIAVAAMIIAVAWPLTTARFDAQAQRRLDTHTGHLAANVEQALAASTAAIAGVGTGLVDQLPGLDPAVFDARLEQVAAAGLLDTVTGVALAVPVATTELDAATQRWHPTVRARVEPRPGPGPGHLLVIHVWPEERAQPVLGLDLTTVGQLDAAARAATDQRRITASEPFVLPGDPDDRSSTVTYLPLSDEDGHVVGLLGVAVRHQPLLETAGTALPGVEDELVHLPSGIVTARIGQRDARSRLAAATAFELYGQRWELRARGDPRPPDSIIRMAAWLLPLTAGLAGGAAFGQVLARRSARLAAALVTERTRELREADAQLRRINEELAATSAVKDEVLAAVSHDVRAPLTVIGGLARTLQRRPEDPALVADAVGRIAHQVERLEALVGDLLTTAAGRDPDPATRHRVDLDALTRRVVEEQGIGAVCSEPIDAWVVVAPLDIERILSNLLHNAERHGDPPVQVTLHAEDRHVEVAVRDHGPGIDPAHDTAIFDPFHQVGRRREGGIGLGLTISLRLARANHGQLRHEHPPEGGARFVLRLPLADDTLETTPETTRREAPETPPGAADDAPPDPHPEPSSDPV